MAFNIDGVFSSDVCRLNPMKMSHVHVTLVTDLVQHTFRLVLSYIIIYSSSIIL